MRSTSATTTIASIMKATTTTKQAARTERFLEAWTSRRDGDELVEESEWVSERERVCVVASGQEWQWQQQMQSEWERQCVCMMRRVRVRVWSAPRAPTEFLTFFFFFFFFAHQRLRPLGDWAAPTATFLLCCNLQFWPPVFLFVLLPTAKRQPIFVRLMLGFWD